ncbi:MAG: hypothetical protein A2667_02910 [Candidatus Wildermuthbacteria bacterium RIFCSPHIGHO2_01_FULL_47_27]|uniref:Uncharacterized protein n=2 Tax=Candidatus Wildermuthiibacteriota TaxID=1817923 RepID=A0A1G2RSJ4_9BACT|nr:MAG: hypothetical protein A2667_02910 [Candidatus Wildermuthbacteria bacterium RIFCSPHIGHO2_01_FULL_47_27]OHA66950.1 MAG: hypothetical protein A3D59_01855 [Candidatus Wildermuthbacteria bacterium RIFCSPHIGHO2_02_FULL_47_17]OHA75824.1 MAG: hypothetical protein A3A32_02050 [Candidatus Wildermuthbacteria bacterium RIFCSPLOWO2_01_FULL_48_35]OHA76548.1 MAG: hypothetical protein A3I38_03705 [Candidatus Wildermuthbacteria bacterium RIFCSPLOWO2_02_FULL_47_10]
MKIWCMLPLLLAAAIAFLSTFYFRQNEPVEAIYGWTLAMIVASVNIYLIYAQLRKAKKGINK